MKPTVYHYLPHNSDDADLEKMVAFCCAVLRWALEGLLPGPEPDFLAMRYGPIYDDALDRLHKMKNGTNEEQSHIHALLSNLRARGSEILNHKTQ